MLDTKISQRFWDGVAQATTLTDKTSVGMLADGNEYIANYRRCEEESHFLKIFEPKKSMRVLEVGTGGGRWAFFLADKVGFIAGIDFSEAMINLAEQQRIEKNIDNIRFVHTDLLSFDDAQKFDLIYFSSVLQYINDDDVLASIQKAKAMLTPGGCIISRDTTQALKRVVMDGEYPVIYRTIDEYKGVFASAGLRLDYCAPSYTIKRFSNFAFRISRWPLMGYRSAHLIQKELLKVNDFLGNPRFLMKKHYREMLDTVGEREHRFFRYHAV
jgi:ubiquinone/menaquinone biosynthesis C-methylase UbiE